jgi:hypothetical protein
MRKSTIKKDDFKRNVIKNVIIAIWTHESSQGVIEAYSSLASFLEIHPEYNEHTITNYLTRKKMPYITDSLTLMKVPYQARKTAEELALLGKKKKPVRHVKNTVNKIKTKKTSISKEKV